MTINEAQLILGVPSNPTPAQIRAAYIKLIKRLHPDAGGWSYLASMVNQARALLLKQST